MAANPTNTINTAITPAAPATPPVAPQAAPAPRAAPRPVAITQLATKPADTGSSVAEAADSLGAILSREDGETETAPKPKRAKAETPPDPKPDPEPEPEAETPDADEDDAEEADPDDADVAEEEGDDDAEEDPDAEEPEDTAKVTVTVDGKAEKVSLADLKSGYLRQSDYTRKTQALAAERQGFATQREAVSQERMQYAQLLPALARQVQAEQPDPAELERLRVEDPMQYVLQREAERDRQQRLDAAKSEYERIREEQLQEQKADAARNLAAERDKLLQAIPAWKDADRRTKDREAIREYGQKLGWTDAELSAVTDHRAVLVLLKAMKYDRAAAKPAPQPDRPAPRPPVLQPTAARAPQPRHVTELTRAKQRLAKTGSARDAAAILEHLL